MLRLSKKSDYALIAMKHLATRPDGGASSSAREISESYEIPLELLAKVLQRSTAKSSTSPIGFDLAKSLAGAKNLSEIVELQTAHWQKQFDALTAQAEEVRVLSTKVTAEPMRARGVAERG